jgi:hypothetical protein
VSTSRPPLTTALLAIPSGAVVGALTALAIVAYAYVLPVFTDPSIEGGVGNPGIALYALTGGLFLGSAFGAVIGTVVAGALVMLWCAGAPRWLCVPAVSIIAATAMFATLFAWFVTDLQVALTAANGCIPLVGGVILLDWTARREVQRGGRFFMK